MVPASVTEQTKKAATAVAPDAVKQAEGATAAIESGSPTAMANSAASTVGADTGAGKVLTAGGANADSLK
jgi:hypothetical protein